MTGLQAEIIAIWHGLKVEILFEVWILFFDILKRSESNSTLWNICKSQIIAKKLGEEF